MSEDTPLHDEEHAPDAAAVGPPANGIADGAPAPAPGLPVPPEAAATAPAPADTSTGAPEGPRASAGSARRGRARRVLTWVLLLLAAVAVGVGGVAVARHLAGVRTAEARLDAAAALLDGAEDDLLIVDEAVQSEISSENATQAAEALLLAEGVKADALAAVAILDEIAPDIEEDVRPLAEALADSGTARAEMMTEAPVILEADRGAALAIGPADAALEEIKAAEASITKAVAEFNKHTADGVKASTANSNDAAARLESARSLLATATAAFPEADFSAFVTYIDAKLELITISKEIDSLWLAGKIEESNNKLDAYNDKDAAIVEIAKALPTSIRDPIADAYETLTVDARERYFAARERARAAGERVGDIRDSATADD
mgnify:CR=1 FL=1